MTHRVLAIAVIVVLACPAPAQTNGVRRDTTAAAVFARAKQLVVTGKGAAGRLLVDSVVAATDRDTPAYADALFWRASLAAASADAERDYRRIVVEYPLSPRAGGALLQLGQLEAARGDRAAAAAHLDRYLLENPNAPDRLRLGLQVIRLLFEHNELQRGCTVLGRVLSEVPETSVEMRNQLQYYSPRCVGVDTTRAVEPAATAAPATPVAPPPTPTPAASTAHEPAEAAHETEGQFTLQVAAYTSRADASRLVKKLRARGIDARLAGTEKLFRVRIGHYATRAEAATAAQQLKAKKITAFVTGVGAEDK